MRSRRAEEGSSSGPWRLSCFRNGRLVPPPRRVACTAGRVPVLPLFPQGNRVNSPSTPSFPPNLFTFLRCRRSTHVRYQGRSVSKQRRRALHRQTTRAPGTSARERYIEKRPKRRRLDFCVQTGLHLAGSARATAVREIGLENCV